jgi:2-dehydro-3-deoxygluconokinase
MTDIVAIGEPLIEFNQIPGSDTYRFGFGGDTANFVCAAARMGASTGYLSRVGDDEFGRRLLALWDREGIDRSAVEVDPQAPTGIYFVTHTDAGHQFSYRRAGSAACAMTLSAPFVRQLGAARHLHVSGISQAISTGACDTVLAALAHARAGGLRTSYDLNFRPRLWPAARAQAIARATLALTDLFLPSIDEAQMLFGIDQPERLIDWAHEQGAANVAVKLGAAGAMVSDGRQRTLVPGHRVVPVDATGAGDCFGGVLSARLLAGDSLVDASHAACVAAALSTQGFGAVDPLPGWSQIAGLLARPAGH